MMVIGFIIKNFVQYNSGDYEPLTKSFFTLNFLNQSKSFHFRSSKSQPPTPLWTEVEDKTAHNTHMCSKVQKR